MVTSSDASQAADTHRTCYFAERPSAVFISPYKGSRFNFCLTGTEARVLKRSGWGFLAHLVSGVARGNFLLVYSCLYRASSSELFS